MGPICWTHVGDGSGNTYSITGKRNHWNHRNHGYSLPYSITGKRTHCTHRTHGLGEEGRGLTDSVEEGHVVPDSQNVAHGGTVERGIDGEDIKLAVIDWRIAADHR